MILTFIDTDGKTIEITPVGLPDPREAMLSDPEAVSVLVMGVVHRALAIDLYPPGADPESNDIEVTTACGLTGTTAFWMHSLCLIPALSSAWADRDDDHPLCPRCPTPLHPE